MEHMMDKIRPVLDQINIVSRDPNASIAFYRRLGVDIPDDNIWRTPSGIHHVNAAEQPCDSAAIHLDVDSAAFARAWNAGWKDRTDLGGRMVIGFSVAARADVDAIYGVMTAAGHRGLQPPVDAFWGARYAIVEDPDGIAVGLMSPIDADRKSPPPAV
jgi:catechol 2,3-dioxygenase-like lactoylglutathione lyase family enzyme